MTNDDIGKLRNDYPSWTLGVIWTSAASGPDRRRLWAIRDGEACTLVTAWSAEALRKQIEELSE